MAVMTMKGMRRAAPGISAEREVRAAAKVGEILGARRDQLKRATTDEQVDRVLSESVLQAISDMTVPLVPVSNHFAVASFALDPASATSIDEVDLLKGNETAGAAASGIPSVVHDLHRDNKIDRPMYLHTIGCIAQLECPLFSRHSWITGMFLKFVTGDHTLIRIPLAQILTGIIQVDSAGAGETQIDLTRIGGGGYELEGPGLPLLKEDTDLSIFLYGPGEFPKLTAAETGEAVLSFFFDGEPMS